MKRRNFLAGVAGTAIGGSALLGSGAFSRVESQRQVSIQVANDANAYLGLKLLDTPNSNNYVDYDEDGHLFINIADQAEGGGQGVNSDSFTYFDGMFELCNQGKAEADISYELPSAPADRAYGDDYTAPDSEYDEQVVTFYYILEGGDDPGSAGDRIMVQEGQEVPLALGECREMGVRTVTKGVDATVDAPLIDGEVVLTANSPEAGQVPDGGGS
ncbi:hypothetical protein SAMN05216226_1433 [Halovenus aranensis]|uniref:Uncharacterized protein n=1 Tax=Halovenus aranensis TaxID=890420 RepID=A0A1G9A0L3_9EURY|nr:hypothetical protein [Halovenus aranensis]SDK20414.1 hypothetical protein SAMN05216226_1433 [Halovenus aranensis]